MGVKPDTPGVPLPDPGFGGPRPSAKVVELRLTIRVNGDVLIDGRWVANNLAVWRRMVEFVVENGAARPTEYVSFGDSTEQDVIFATQDGHEWLRFGAEEFFVEGQPTTEPHYAYLALLAWIDACHVVELHGPIHEHRRGDGS